MDTWTQSPHHDPLRLDGVYVHETGIVPLDKEPSPGAATIPMADGGTIYQCPLHDLEGQKPPIVTAYRWPLQVQADTEEGYYLLLGLSRRGAAVELIDFDFEVESFTAGLSTTSFTLPRTPASAAWASFPTADYPTRAFVDGVEQTVVATAPGAGEVQIVGTAITTPALSPGAILTIRYVPAYSVVVSPPARRLARFNDLSLVFDLVEVLSP